MEKESIVMTRFWRPRGAHIFLKKMEESATSAMKVIIVFAVPSSGVLEARAAQILCR